MTGSAPSTRMAPARPPDGWWMGHRRYRSYVLFAATGGVLAVGCIVLLFGIHALGQGPEAWKQYLVALGSPAGTALASLLLVGTLFFSLRWLRVGIKIPQVAIGPLPAPPAALIGLMHYAGLAGLTALLLGILSGWIL